ncbi:LptA/OstA family protein, partial [Rhodoplanes roseus]
VAALTAGVLAAAPLAVDATLGTAAAQPAGGSNPPNALQGFAQNRDKPVKIESASLEVRDKEKMATFAGDVHLVQGDVTLKCRSLVVFYEPDAKQDAKDTKPAAKPANTNAMAGGSGSQQIKRIEARGDVMVSQKDQVAVGDNGIFDMKANTVTLVGNVVISQGPNAVRGDRLVVDMTTGRSQVLCDKGTQCRVQAVLMPGSQKAPEGGGPAAGAPSGNRDAAREPPRPRSGGPSPTGLY